MSRESNKEIDVLLRKLSGKWNGNSAADSNSAAGVDDHLDADELNAYAEQALPAATRARYTAHLADCGRCRKLVTQVSLSSTAVVSARAEEKAPSGLKAFLASLFSPMVIRYAVPAMAVIIVVALAWIGVRRSSPRPELASNVVRTPAETAINRNEQPAAATSQPTSEGFTKQDVDQRGDVTKLENKQAGQKRQGNVGEEQVATAAAPAPPTTTTEVAKSTDDLVKRPQPSEPAAAPATAPGSVAGAKPPSDAEKNEATRQKKDESALARDAKAKEEDRGAFQAAGQANVSGPAKTQGGLDSQSERAAKLRAARREAPSKKVFGTREQETEVRSVGGHRFERRGQVWVDVLYESQSITNVSRGSEQYRALIGDEPGMRTIAEELKGELIVVWKGRAYRIR